MLLFIKEWFEYAKGLIKYKNTLTASLTVCFLLLFIHYHMGHITKVLPYPQGFYLPFYFIMCGFFLLLFPLITAPFIKDCNAFGLKTGNCKTWLVDLLIGFIIVLLLILVFGRTEAFKGTYPLFRNAKESWRVFAFYEGTQFIYLSGWEFLFRGYLLFSLRKDTGDPAAIIIQMIPYALLHAGKPEIESFCSIIAGILLGIIAIRGKSILPCILLHFSVAFSMDLIGLI